MEFTYKAVVPQLYTWYNAPLETRLTLLVRPKDSNEYKPMSGWTVSYRNNAGINIAQKGYSTITIYASEFEDTPIFRREG